LTFAACASSGLLDSAAQKHKSWNYFFSANIPKTIPVFESQIKTCSQKVNRLRFGDVQPMRFLAVYD
jgi:hypothetical protein